MPLLSILVKLRDVMRVNMRKESLQISTLNDSIIINMIFPGNLSVSMNCLSLSSSAKHLGHLSLPLIRKSMFSLLDRQLRLC